MKVRENKMEKRNNLGVVLLLFVPPVVGVPSAIYLLIMKFMGLSLEVLIYILCLGIVILLVACIIFSLIWKMKGDVLFHLYFLAYIIGIFGMVGLFKELVFLYILVSMVLCFVCEYW
jgi:hypothetical protein